MKILVNKILNHLGYKLSRLKESKESRIKRYLSNQMRPWSDGYIEYKHEYIQHVLCDQSLKELFYLNKKLPDSFGLNLDERCIEYPWLISRLDNNVEMILDAGSALNHKDIIEYPVFKNKKIKIMTLVPETNCFWNKAISYEYGDLCETPFRDNLFDVIVCMSTLEHIGMDNQFYTNQDCNEKNTMDPEI